MFIGSILGAFLWAKLILKPVEPDNSGSTPTIRLKKFAAENTKPDPSYQIKNRVVLPNSLTEQIKPGSEEYLIGATFLKNENGEIVESIESPVKVLKNESGDLEIETETPVIVIAPRERQSRWKAVITVPDAGPGLAYQWKKFWLLDCDIMITTSGLATGVSKKFSYGYLGFAGNWNIDEGRLEPIGYLGIGIQF